jgi:hypothetical protein
VVRFAADATSSTDLVAALAADVTPGAGDPVRQAVARAAVRHGRGDGHWPVPLGRRDGGQVIMDPASTLGRGALGNGGCWADA